MELFPVMPGRTAPVRPVRPDRDHERRRARHKHHKRRRNAPRLLPRVPSLSWRAVGGPAEPHRRLVQVPSSTSALLAQHDQLAPAATMGSLLRDVLASDASEARFSSPRMLLEVRLREAQRLAAGPLPNRLFTGVCCVLLRELVLDVAGEDSSLGNLASALYASIYAAPAPQFDSPMTAFADAVPFFEETERLAVAAAAKPLVDRTKHRQSVAWTTEAAEGRVNRLLAEACFERWRLVTRVRAQLRERQERHFEQAQLRRLRRAVFFAWKQWWRQSEALSGMELAHRTAAEREAQMAKMEEQIAALNKEAQDLQAVNALLLKKVNKRR